MSVSGSESRRFLNESRIEIVNESVARGPKRCILFDFDGTLSLIRSGWQQLMIPMMAEILLQTPQAESPEQIQKEVTAFVEQLTGKQTMYQLTRLCEEVKKRGGKPLHPLEYKRLYHERLSVLISGRIAGLREGRAKPDELLLPGSRAILENLSRRGVKLYLASGTDTSFVLEEARLLKIDGYFTGGIFGAEEDWQRSDKDTFIRRIVSENALNGSELLTFGDGFVEIEETHKIGGVTVGVASDEKRNVEVNEWKRYRLLQAGADIIIANYLEQETLISYLWEKS